MERAITWVLVAALGCGVAPAFAGDARAKGKPRLDLRASPRLGFAPADVFVVAELKGGQPIEDLYCPRLEWDWGDGSRSVEESDCPPFRPDQTDRFERFFSARHVYSTPGNYDVRVAFQRADRTVAMASVAVVLQGERPPEAY